ncbi:MAG: response regulator transcription factor [Eubacteriales bacterium]|nr:response regulator transcription factor [Eubacteriales bacterium]
MKNKILVIEDDMAISELLCMNLSAAGYEAAAAYDGVEAERLIMDHQDADLALVDIMLPGKDGFQLMEDFRKRKLPVIFLTAKGDVASKVKGLKLGAEDYMVKPFEILELLVRIEKVLERTGRAKRMMKIRDIEVDLVKHQVTKQGQYVSLKPMEYDLLVLLLRNRNVALSREEILNRVWGDDYMGESRTVDVHIGQLRKKLGLYDEIHTIPKLGYRLEEE